MRKNIALIILCILTWLPLIAAPRKAVGRAAEQPDFAFPQTVATDARAAMRSAMQRADYVQALAEAMQLCIADNLVDKANTPAALATIDSLARLMPAPEAALARMIEAQIYADYYSSASYQFNQRTLPLNSYPENIADWGRGLFAKKINELIGSSLGGFDGNGLSLAAMGPVLTSVEAADYIPDEYNFLRYKAIDLLQRFSDGGSGVIPFADASRKNSPAADGGKSADRLSAASVIAQLLAHNQSYTSKKPLAYAMTVKSGMLSGDERLNYVEQCLKQLEGEPESVMLLAEYAASSDFGSYAYEWKNDYTDALRRANEFCVKADAALTRWPEAMGSARLRNFVEALRQPRLDVKYGGQHLSTVPFRPKLTVCNSPVTYILLYRLPVNRNSDRGEISRLVQGRTPVATLKVDMAGGAEGKLTRLDTVVDFGRLDYGRYLAVPSLTASASGIPATVQKDYAQTMLVSDLRTLTATASGDKQIRRIYVVNGADGRPVAGARVELLEYKKGALHTAHTLFTDADGGVDSPRGNWKLRVSKGKDVLPADAYLYTNGKPDEKRSKAASLLTDLSVYHPGDSVGFAAVVYSVRGRERKALAGEPLTVNLRDANNSLTATVKLTTDEFGRASGHLNIPTAGLLGSWSLEALCGEENAGWQYFQVADYKAPTFFVAVDSVSSPAKVAGGEVTVRGKVMTYSGMPVAGADVNYDIRYVSHWWWRGSDSPDAVYSGSTSTDESGTFELCLSTDGLKDSPYSFGRYRLSVSATSPSGETQQAPAASFALGSAYRIEPRIDEQVEALTDSLRFDVRVVDMLGFPARRKVKYQLLTADANGTAGGKPVSEGVFTSPLLELNAARIASGAYRFKFMVEGADSASTADASFVLFRATDKRPPVAEHLWTPQRRIVAKAGQKEVEVTVGSAFTNSHILCYAADVNGRIEARWLEIDNANKHIKVPVSAPGEASWLTFATVDSLLSYTSTVKIEPASVNDRLTIATETFRDKIVPGEQERWTFRVSYADKAMAGLPLMAVLSDKALNAIAPFSWQFMLRGNGGLYNPLHLSADNPGSRSERFALAPLNQQTTRWVDLPEWQTYGYSLVPYGYRRLHIRGRGKGSTVRAEEVVEEVYTTSAPLMMNAAVAADCAQSKKKLEESAVESESAADDTAGTDAGARASEESTPLREMEQPLGFFMPSLVTSAGGEGVISFKVPDFNTTWQLQLASYTPQMQTAVATFETTAQKPVMVRCNAPRFVRTSDRVSVSATLYNAGIEPAAISGEIQVIEPISGAIIASVSTKPGLVPASGSHTFTDSFTVPDSISYLLLRVYARSTEHSDGEQTLVAVLPASTPVTESTAFYMQPSQQQMSLTLPKFNAGSQLTLQYCDNPVWYCVTALPAIAKPESKSLLSLLRAYYAGAMAKGLVGRYPAIRSGLEQIIASEPKSPLSENNDLKNVELINTPWVNNASAETARMRSLGVLTGADATPTLDALAADIIALQNPDGGWSWCRGMQSSEFMTTRVLLHFGMLRQCGYMPDSKRINSALASGRKFVDSEMLTYFRRNRNRISASTATEWLYVRGFYPATTESPALKTLHAKAVQAIRTDWRSLSIAAKARAAIVLNREGYGSLASKLLESLRQLAVYTPDAGMRYENLPAGYGNGTAPLAATAQVLEAFAAIEPGSQSVDRLRQGLILQRQAQDWGADSYTVEVVNAILTSGSDWTQPAAAPEITLAGRSLPLPAASTPVGYYRIDLPLAGTSGAELKVNRSAGGPAWGSVMSRYVAPIVDVKAASMPEISITKAIYKIVDRPGETVQAGGELKVGDKVRVTLTINSSRDMDYVAVTDARSACLEPTDQISSYRNADGLWFYQETRDASTNFFIGYLPKGSHVISYDCYVDRAGDYTLGIAAAQSQYAPQITAHSAGALIEVK